MKEGSFSDNSGSNGSTDSVRDMENKVTAEAIKGLFRTLSKI